LSGVRLVFIVFEMPLRESAFCQIYACFPMTKCSWPSRSQALKWVRGKNLQAKQGVKGRNPGCSEQNPCAGLILDGRRLKNAPARQREGCLERDNLSSRAQALRGLTKAEPRNAAGVA